MCRSKGQRENLGGQISLISLLSGDGSSLCTVARGRACQRPAAPRSSEERSAYRSHAFRRRSPRKIETQANGCTKSLGRSAQILPPTQTLPTWPLSLRGTVYSLLRGSFAVSSKPLLQRNCLTEMIAVPAVLHASSAALYPPTRVRHLDQPLHGWLQVGSQTVVARTMGHRIVDQAAIVNDGVLRCSYRSLVRPGMWYKRCKSARGARGQHTLAPNIPTHLSA